MSSTATSADEEHARKRVRKGTHSCWECRRRKVRCIFKSQNLKCNGCLARGANCQSQKDVDEENAAASATKSIPDRVGRLESLMETFMQNFAQSGSYNVPTPASSSGLNLHESAPVLSLFNNAVFDRNDTEKDIPEMRQNAPLGDTQCNSGGVESKTEKVRRTLLALVPPRKHLEAVFESSGDWWSVWQQAYPGICANTGSASLIDSISQLLTEGRPTAIANVLLCLAISLQQLPSTFDFSVMEVSCSAKDLVEKYTSAVGSLVNSDDEFAASIEGLECLTLAGKIHLNAGKPHRALLSFKRAMNVAEIIGLHRNSTRVKMGSDDIAPARKRSVWWQIYQADRLLSLLLGLSHGLADEFCDLNADDETTETTYLRKISIIATRICDRNQAVAGPSFALTHELDGQLEGLSKQMPQSWWSLPSDLVTTNTVTLMCRVVPQFWHYQVEILLHLPFMLRSATEPKFDYNKLMCLKASREMTKRFICLREKAKAWFYTCQMVEFQAFLGTVVIQLNLIDTMAAKSVNEDPRQMAKDMEMVDMIIHDLMCSGTGSGVAQQAIEVLETLRAVGRNEGLAGNRFKLSIPYFGTISITRGCKLRDAGLDAPSFPAMTPTYIPQQGFAAESYQPTLTSNQSPILQDSSTESPQISFTSSIFAPNNGLDEGWSFLGDLGPPFENSRIADLDGTWDWLLDDNLAGV